MHIRFCWDPKQSQAFHGTLPGSADSQALEVTAMDAAPIPPPPLPPPPPPPPPLASVSSPGRMDSARRQRLRNVNWERIPKERVEGRKSVWNDPIAGEEDDFPIDLRSLDELFGQKEAQKTDRGNSFRRSLRRCRSPQETAIDKVSLLDSKRSMNIGIFLRQFKTEAKEIVEDVRQGAGMRYGAEKLAELCKLLPDSEEEARLKKFNADRSTLGEPDFFMLLLVEVPNFRLRLDTMILQQEFDPAVTSLCVAARCLGEAARELLGCHKLHSILRLVLKAGNYMNAGGYAGNAAGFRIASLLKLADTKANKPGMNLLHFVAMEAVKKDEDLLTFPSLLSHVGPASRLSEESIMEDLSRLQCRVGALRISMRAEAEIEQQTRPFLEGAEVRLREAQEEVDSLCKTSQALVEFFCEDESSFKLEEACRTFHSFCHRFQKAVQENTERERQEQRRVERERENMEKRRSLALCGSFELGREPDDLERTLERNLSYTWSRRSLRRHSQSILSHEEKSLDSKYQQPLSSDSRDPRQVPSSRGCDRASVLGSHMLVKDNANTTNGQRGNETNSMHGGCTLGVDYGSYGHALVTPRTGNSQADATLDQGRLPNVYVSPELSSIPVQEQGSMNVAPLVGICPNMVLLVETRVHSMSERLTHITVESPEMRKLDSMGAAEGSSQPLQTESRTTPHTGAERPSSPVAEMWLGSCPPEITPHLAREPEPASPDREHTYARPGEIVECHTLVKGLRSYEALSPAGSRPAPSHCSKWRKELEAEEREGASSPQAKEDSHIGKTPTRGPTKRGLGPRNRPSSSTGVPKVRAKAELSLEEGPGTPRPSRLAPSRASSMRASVTTQPAGTHSDLKRSSSTRDRNVPQSDPLVKLNRRPTEKAIQEKDKALPKREPFVRGSPLRVSKRLAPNSESQSPCQTRAVHSPTAATNAKTIRTAVISAAKAKTGKNMETTSGKTAPGTKTSGPRIPRPGAQPMWR